MARKFVNPLGLPIFYLFLSGDESLNNYTNYNTSLKLLQPEIRVTNIARCCITHVLMRVSS